MLEAWTVEPMAASHVYRGRYPRVTAKGRRATGPPAPRYGQLCRIERRGDGHRDLGRGSVHVVFVPSLQEHVVPLRSLRRIRLDPEFPEFQERWCSMGGIDAVFVEGHMDPTEFLRRAVLAYAEVAEMRPTPTVLDVEHSFYRFQPAPEESEFCTWIVCVREGTRGAIPVTELVID